MKQRTHRCRQEAETLHLKIIHSKSDQRLKFQRGSEYDDAWTALELRHCECEQVVPEKVKVTTRSILEWEQRCWLSLPGRPVLTLRVGIQPELPTQSVGIWRPENQTRHELSFFGMLLERIIPINYIFLVIFGSHIFKSVSLLYLVTFYCLCFLFRKHLNWWLCKESDITTKWQVSSSSNLTVQPVSRVQCLRYENTIYNSSVILAAEQITSIHRGLGAEN